MNNLLIYIDNIPVYTPLNSTVIQACDKIGLNIPRFCYHDLLGIAGNCRICLIEVERSPKPQVACGLPVLNKIKIYTRSSIVLKAREAVLEFLLLNHPLDCPICDQGGHCDLQNQTKKYGSARSRFFKSKRGVEDKGFGPVVKTVITRCIHCTRCVRFAIDIAGVGDLGTLLRGVKTEVGTYTSKKFISEVSGNVIDLCPVGALTLKSHAFKTRPWEIRNVKTIDLTDCLGSHISIKTKKSLPMKIVPRPCLEINEEWITDKARFAYEGFSKTRLAVAYYYKNNIFNPFFSSHEINQITFKFLTTQKKIQIIFGRNIDCDTGYRGIHICKNLGWDFLAENLDKIYPVLPCFFQSTITLNNLDQTKFCLIVGINPRTEASLVNLRLNKQIKKGRIKGLSLGNPYDLQYKVKDLGLQLTHLLNLSFGIHSQSLFINYNPTFIYGDLLTKRLDAHSTLSLSFLTQITSKTKNNFKVLHLPLGANSIGNAFLGLTQPTPLVTSNEAAFYFLGLQDSNLLAKIKSDFVFENTHYNNTKYKPKFLLPLQSSYEKSGLYINYQGHLQKSSNFIRFAQKPLSPGTSFSDIDLYLHSTHNPLLFFTSLSSNKFQKLSLNKIKLKCYTTPLQQLVGDMYITDPITSTSLTLSKVSGIIRQVYWSFKN